MEAQTTTAADPALERGTDLERKLAGYSGPVYRKAYLVRLAKSGLDLLRAGDLRSAEYCLGKVEAELVRSAEGEARGGSTGADGAVGVDTMSGSPAAAGTSAKAPPHALERLRIRWREERIRKAGEVLERHGRRLSSLERKAYGESLTRWSVPTGASAVRGFEARADAGILELRRRLYGRILKTHKADLARRSGHAPVLVPLREGFAGPVGPYNDRHNLEGVITLLAQADPAWVEEFLALYRNLGALKDLMPALPGVSRK